MVSVVVVVVAAAAVVLSLILYLYLCRLRHCAIQYSTISDLSDLGPRVASSLSISTKLPTCRYAATGSR